MIVKVILHDNSPPAPRISLTPAIPGQVSYWLAVSTFHRAAFHSLKTKTKCRKQKTFAKIQITAAQRRGLEHMASSYDRGRALTALSTTL